MLYAVRRLGDATVDDSRRGSRHHVSGARQHLTRSSTTASSTPTETSRDRPGTRPPAADVPRDRLADALFPKAYGALTNELLGYLAEETDRRTIDRLFARAATSASQALTPGSRRRRSLGAKVDELARILDEDGYLATVRDASDATSFRIVEHNCAIAAVARRYGQACTSEIDFIRAVPSRSRRRTRRAT